MSPHEPTSLSPEEHALAQRLARLGPHGEPSPALDTRILAAAHAAVGGRRAPHRPAWRSWPLGLGIAASLALVLGVAWRLRPLPDVAPAYRSEAESALRSAPAAANANALPDRAAAAASATVAPSTAAPSTATPAVAADVAQPAPRAAPRPVAPPAPAPVPVAPQEPPVVFGAPAPVPSPASAPAPPPPAETAAPAAAAGDRAAAVPAVAPAPRTGDASKAATDAGAAATPAQRAPVPAAPQAPAAPQKPAVPAVTPAAPQKAAVPAVTPAPTAGSIEAAAGNDEPVNDVPPATVATPQVREAWLARIRELAATGRRDEARASLREFRHRYPEHPLPDDLRALLP